MPVPNTVLLLEDEALIILDLTLELESRGMTVLATQTVDAALAAIQSGIIRLAVLDLMLKGEVTTPVAEELRRRSIPFIVCSGSQMSMAASSAFDGILCFDKPYHSDDIYEALIALDRQSV